MSCCQQYETMNLRWSWAGRKPKSTVQSESSDRAHMEERGGGLFSSRPGEELCVCFLEVTGKQKHLCGSWPERVSLESWEVSLGSPGESLWGAGAGVLGQGDGGSSSSSGRTSSSGNNLFGLAGVGWSQEVTSWVNCLHGQENEFAVILQPAIFLELHLFTAICHLLPEELLAFHSCCKDHQGFTEESKQDKGTWVVTVMLSGF